MSNKVALSDIIGYARGVPENTQKSGSAAPNKSSINEDDERELPDSAALTLPSFVAGSGALERLASAARGYARAAASENTLKAYAEDWAQFARWC